MEFLLIILNFLPLWMYLLIAALSLFYFYNTRDFDYWKKQGVPGPKPYFLIGTTRAIWKINFHNLILDAAAQYGPIYGGFEGSKPVLSVADPDLLKQICIKDFHIFTNRRSLDLVERDKVAGKMLSILRDDEWKITRNTVSPTHTTGKLKQMVQLVEESVQILIESLQSNAENGEIVDCSEIFPNLTMDIIASVAFGVKVDCIKNPQGEFMTKVKNFQPRPFVFYLMLLFSSILKWIPPIYPNPLKYFADIAQRTIDMRLNNEENKRKDFLQILLEAEIPDEDTTDLQSRNEQQSSKKTLTRDVIVSQIVQFLLAGHETTANTLKLMAYELAINQNIQEKLIREVDDIMLECKGKLNYDNIASMQYLDMVLSETLRKYPPAVGTDRQCSEDGYNLNDIILRKGLIVSIPIYAIHHDPKNYPDPDLFDPERFSAENKATRNPFTYLPFGAGPRNCVAMRFALMELKLVMALMLFTYRFQTCQETEFPLKFEVGTPMMRPTSVILKIQKRIDQPHFD